MRLRFALSLMTTAGLLAGCVASAVGPPPLAQLPDRVVTAQVAPDAAGLVLTVEAQPEPAAQGYRTQYVRVIDWEVAEASLTNSDGTIPALNRSVPVSVSSTLARTASLYFAPVKPAGNYTLTIALMRRDRTGTYQTVASGTRTALTLAPGTNTASVTLSTTTAGEVSISAPTPSLTAPTPPTVTGFFPASGSVGMWLDVTGTYFSTTPADNGVKVNGVAATVGSASAGQLAVRVPTGAGTGPVAVTVEGRTATSGSSFTVVPAGTALGTFGTGAGPKGVAADASGQVWVVNGSGTTVSRFGPTGALLGTHFVGGNGYFAAAAPNGEIWVTHYASPGTVTRLSSTGTVIGTHTVGTQPVAIAFDASGNGWVSNYGGGTLTKLSPTGAVLGTYTVPTSMPNPGGIAIDASGNAWVTVQDDTVVAKLSPTGTVLGTYSVGSGPTDVTFDASGNLWVTLEASGQIVKVSPAGAVLGTYPANAGPRHVVTDLNGVIWVANTGANQVTKLSGAGNILGTFAVAGAPQALAVDRNNAVWVTLGSGLNSVVKLAN